ncbi:hypothetical protein [Dietzia sp.]|uniref:hypothetical protein n=1 Tax=Dietzia sp. TaxID=1871616 RepID=UPI002FD89D01
MDELHVVRHVVRAVGVACAQLLWVLALLLPDGAFGWVVPVLVLVDPIIPVPFVITAVVMALLVALFVWRGPGREVVETE